MPGNVMVNVDKIVCTIHNHLLIRIDVIVDDMGSVKDVSNRILLFRVQHEVGVDFQSSASVCVMF